MKEDLYEGETPVSEIGYYTDLLGERAVNFIRQQGRDKSFFLSLHYLAPHWPWEGRKDADVAARIEELFHADGGDLATYAKMVVAMDASIGGVLRVLEHRGLAENTIAVFTSDNGGEQGALPRPERASAGELKRSSARTPRARPGRLHR